MKPLTPAQKEFLLTFFEDKKFAGWKNIANSLLDTGSCIVAGEECIWRGGIGNFIKVTPTPAPNFVGCSEYTFNVESFMDSAWYKEKLNFHKEDSQTALEELEKNYGTEKKKLTEILNW